MPTFHICLSNLAICGLRISLSESGLTVRYKFNTTRSKYKGTGAGNAEKNRL